MSFTTLTCPSCGSGVRQYQNPLPTVDIIIEMQDGIILDVGVVTGDDAVDVTAQDRVVPNAGGFTQGDGACHHRAVGDIDIPAQRRSLAQEPVELA